MLRTQKLFQKVTHEAEATGVKVHGGKTKTICIAETKQCVPRAHFFDQEGNIIETVSKMNILEFHFSSDSDMTE